MRPVAPLQRMKDAKAREAHEVAMLLPVQENTNTEVFSSYSRGELVEDHAFFVQSESDSNAASNSAASGLSLQSQVAELEGEVARLREQLGKAKGVNDAMWETMVKRLVEGKDEKDQAAEQNEQDAEDGSRRRKRGRV